MAGRIASAPVRRNVGGARDKSRARGNWCHARRDGAAHDGKTHAATGEEATASNSTGPGGRRGLARYVLLGGLAIASPIADRGLFEGFLRRDAEEGAATAATSSFNTVDDAGSALLKTDAVSLPPIMKERFAPADVALSVPSALWQSRGRMKPPEKKLLYTDTYGPSNQYRFELPRWVNSVDGRSCLTGLSVSVQSAPGSYDGIDEIGDINSIDVQVLDLPGDIESADIMYAKPRYNQIPGGNRKQAYYQWDLAIPDPTCVKAICPYAEVVLVSATISGGGLYVVSIRANQDEWLAQESNLKKLRDSFTVLSADVSSMDTSSRVYGN